MMSKVSIKIIIVRFLIRALCFTVMVGVTALIPTLAFATLIPVIGYFGWVAVLVTMTIPVSIALEMNEVNKQTKTPGEVPLSQRIAAL